jgi:outer membrane biosynthesis protein TonB
MSAESLNRRFVYIPSTALVLSLLLHLLTPFFVMGLKALDARNFKKTQDKKEAQSFIQVDMVALPDNLLSDTPKVDTSLPMVDKAKSLLDEAKAKEDILALSEKARIEKEKEMSEKVKKEKEKEKEQQRKTDEEKALKKLAEDAKREQALKQLLAKNGKTGRQKMLGNKLSQGVAATGAIGNLKDKYAALVGQALKEHFNIFPWQKKKGLSAVVKIEIFPNGRIKSRKLIKKSIDASYDSAVLQSVDDTQSLPTPEDPSIVADGITVEMRPEE